MWLSMVGLLPGLMVHLDALTDIKELISLLNTLLLRKILDMFKIFDLLRLTVRNICLFGSLQEAFLLP